MEMEVVGDGTFIYMRSSMFGSLPDGHEWMGLDLALGQELDTPLPANGDAKAQLELLEAATGDVQKLGKERVRGVPTTRYRGTVDVSEQAELMRNQGAEDLASLTEEEGTPMQVEAWIDAEGLVRRIRLLRSLPPEGGQGSTTMDMRMVFFDFGIDPRSTCPSRAKYSMRPPWPKTSSACDWRPAVVLRTLFQLGKPSRGRRPMKLVGSNPINCFAGME
ncbi:MAG TPA: hypothetical protein VFZ41_08180 [Solirubrobacterales bacterium]